ncbi:cytochrome P450 [Brasilonema sp. UFV-L1]|uniref:cytochrome P450 n=1 Tax=Brasilonema sp. UFV-L1 TaxID=2234130 RepID=UPI00145D9903|nr:cytochrome P450 [Brasilonema sp. UFV-L1]NMG08651.1 cytochrome P450 [Brasilonema sp. UFV-L1]
MITLSSLTQNQNKIPNSKTPSLLQLFSFVLDPVAYLETGFARLGEVFWAYAPMHAIIAASPEAIRQVFAAGNETFSIMDNASVRLILGGEGSMGLVSGEEHIRQRQVLGPAFRGERLQACRELVCQVTRSLLDEKHKVVTEDIAQIITMTTILSFTFGSFEEERYQTIARELTFQLEIIESPLKALQLFVPFFRASWGSWGKWQRSRKIFFEEVAAEAQKRRQAGMSDQGDVLSLLIKEGETNDRICSQVMTMLFAGRESTSYTLAWILYWICTLPEVQHKLLAEIDSGEDYMSLPYLDAVIKEALRIYPPAFIFGPRVTKVPFKLLDWELEPGTVVFPCPYLIHHRKEIYPEPKTFRPERFLERQFTPYEYLPFGGGHRTCIAMALALFELKLAIGTILSEYNVELADKRPVRAVRRGAVLGPERYELLVERR